MNHRLNDNLRTIKELRKEDKFTDGMLIAYAILEVGRTLREIHFLDIKEGREVKPLEAIAMALGFGGHDDSIASALIRVAEAIER